jgi:ADP-heptose:LPS heptosyltransferase
MFPRLSLFVSSILQNRKQKKDFLKIEGFIRSEQKSIDTLPLLSEPKKGTLIVKCDDIGDFLLWQQVIPYIKANAEGPITFVGNSVVRPLMEAWFDFADHYIWIEKSKWEDANYRTEIYKEIRSINPKVAFTPLFTRHFRMDDLMVYASNAETRFAWDRSHHPYFPGMEASDPLITNPIKSPKVLRLEYLRHIEFIEKVYKIEIPHEVKPLFPNFTKYKTLIVFPAANTKSRWWNYKKYAQTIKAVSPLFDKIFILGGPNAVEYAKQIELAANEPKLVNMVNQTALTELMAFIGEASVLLCPDTSAMHFSMLTATNTVVLSNGNNWQRFANYQPYVQSKFNVVFPPYFKPDPNKVKLNYSGAEIQSTTVSQVVEAIKECVAN